MVCVGCLSQSRVSHLLSTAVESVMNPPSQVREISAKKKCLVDGLFHGGGPNRISVHGVIARRTVPGSSGKPWIGPMALRSCPRRTHAFDLRSRDTLLSHL